MKRLLCLALALAVSSFAAASQRDETIASAANALSVVTAPNLAFSAPIAEVETALNALEELRAIGVTHVTLRAKDGLLRVEVEFTRRVTEADLGADADVPQELRDLLRQRPPVVTGRAVLFAGIRSIGPELRLKVLPKFDSARIEKVVVSGEEDTSGLADWLTRLVNARAAEIDRSLASSPLLDVVLPATLGSFDPSQLVRVSADANLRIDAQPVASPVRLLGIATLITNERIVALAQLVPLNGADPPPGSPIAPTLEAVRTAFDDRIANAFALPQESSGPWLAMRKDLVSTIVNGVLERAKLCVAVNGEMQQRLQQEITFPDGTGIDCTPDRACDSTRACNFPVIPDERSCHGCIARNPFNGSCILEGNVPECEIAKAVENKRREAVAAGQKFDCERIKWFENEACAAERTAQQASCEAGKVALQLLARTGKFGNLEASVQARSEDLRACLRSFVLKDDLSQVHAELDVQGGVAADVSMKFTPLDIVGHLACQAPFTEDRSFHAALQASDVTIDSAIALTAVGDRAVMKFEVQASTVPVSLQPGPTEFLLTSPNLLVACQGLNLIKPLLFALTPFVPELRGKIDYEIPKQSVAIELALPTQNIGPLKLHGTVKDNDCALFLVTTSPPPDSSQAASRTRP